MIQREIQRARERGERDTTSERKGGEGYSERERERERERKRERERERYNERDTTSKREG